MQRRRTRRDAEVPWHRPERFARSRSLMTRARSDRIRAVFRVARNGSMGSIACLRRTAITAGVCKRRQSGSVAAAHISRDRKTNVSAYGDAFSPRNRRAQCRCTVRIRQALVHTVINEDGTGVAIFIPPLAPDGECKWPTSARPARIHARSCRRQDTRRQRGT